MYDGAEGAICCGGEDEAGASFCESDDHPRESSVEADEDDG